MTEAWGWCVGGARKNEVWWSPRIEVRVRAERFVLFFKMYPSGVKSALLTWAFTRVSVIQPAGFVHCAAGISICFIDINWLYDAKTTYYLSWNNLETSAVLYFENPPQQHSCCMHANYDDIIMLKRWDNFNSFRHVMQIRGESSF